MKQNITITKKELEHINELVGMLGEEIKEKYGYECGKIISNSTVFSNSVEAKIRLIVSENGFHPITEIVLYEDGKELTHEISIDSHYAGTWEIIHDGINYVVNVTAN